MVALHPTPQVCPQARCPLGRALGPTDRKISLKTVSHILKEYKPVEMLNMFPREIGIIWKCVGCFSENLSLLLAYNRQAAWGLGTNGPQPTCTFRGLSSPAGARLRPVLLLGSDLGHGNQLFCFLGSFYKLAPFLSDQMRNTREVSVPETCTEQRDSSLEV